VQVGLPTNRITVKFALSDSDAVGSVGVAMPLVQTSETVTSAGLLSEKSLFTLKVPLFCVFVIVQEALPPMTSDTLPHGAWLAV
jgi:hypothetical protein